MARLFISHSSANNVAAIALCEWLTERGFSDVFLDVDPERGLVAGQRWQEALRAAADRCEAVLFLVSPAWIASKWCLAEFLLAKTLHKRIFGLVVEPVPLERIPVEMTAEWQICELVGDDPLRTFDIPIAGKQERIAFREAGLDLLRRGLERAGLDGRGFSWPPSNEPARTPYRGLRALDSQDAAVFFGRDAAIVRGFDRIRGLTESGLERLLVILGASGSGKSSFLRAGLWPRLARDDLSFLTLPIIRPQSAVITGDSGLVASLSLAFDRFGETRSPGRIKQVLNEDPVGFETLLDELSALADRRLVGTGAENHPVIVLAIDQAEELFGTEGLAEAATFLHMLGRTLASGQPARRILAIATIRSDRYELLQTEPNLIEVKQDLFNLSPIPPTEFKAVIEGPARRVVDNGGRLAVDPMLTERLIADAQGADTLPLLAFTLERLYADYGSEGKLTLAEYEQLGGMKGSIEAAIAQALAEPSRLPQIPAGKEEQLSCLRMAFIPWLARIDAESGLAMRRVAQLDEIPRESRAVVQRLVEARLLLIDRRGAVDVIEVAHESLFRQWPALSAWLEAEAANLRLVEGIERATNEWVSSGRLTAWLDHRGERLEAANRLSVRTDFQKRFTDDVIAYLTACRMQANVEDAKRRRAGRYRALAVASLLLLLMAGGLGGPRIYSAINLQRTIDQEASRTDIRGEIYAYAGVADRGAVDPADSGSPYTTPLLVKLRQEDKSLLAALQDVNQEVIGLTAGRQRPLLSTSMNGNLYLWHQPQSRRRQAIVVSVDNPGFCGPDCVLKSSQHDADGVDALLRQTGSDADDVVRLHNVGQQEIREAVKRVCTHLAELTPPVRGASNFPIVLAGFGRVREPPTDTLTVFYFSGYGMQIGGRNYLFPVMGDEPVKDERDVEYRAVDLDSLRDNLSRCSSAVVLIMDAQSPNVSTNFR